MRIEFYCETLSFWVILVNIWWFWVIFRWSIFDDLWCFFVSSRSLCHGFTMDSHLTARLKASLDMVSTAIPWLQPRPSLRSQQKVNSKGTWKNGCFGILIDVTRFHLLGHFRFPFSAKMWVFFWGGRVCIFEPSQIDGKIRKKKKQVDLFTKPGFEPFPFEKKICWLGKKAKKLWMIWPGPPLKLATTGKPEAAASNKQRPNGSDLAAWTKTPWDFEAHLGIWNVPPKSLFVWGSCMLIMSSCCMNRCQSSSKLTHHVDLKKTIHNEKPLNSKALKDFAHRFPWQGFQASNFSMQGWEVGLNCFLKFLSDLLFWWFFIALLCTKQKHQVALLCQDLRAGKGVDLIYTSRT